MPALKDPKTGKLVFFLEEEDEEEPQPQPKQKVELVTQPDQEEDLVEPEPQEEDEPEPEPEEVHGPEPEVVKPEEKPKKNISPHAYWAIHKYRRRSVEVALDEYPFGSWQQVIDLCQRAMDQGKDTPVFVRGKGWYNKGERDAAIIAALFLGGFRRQELCHKTYKLADGSVYEVGIKKGDYKRFIANDGREFIEFQNIHILKKYKRIKDPSGHYKTERLRAFRTFVFPAKEPLVVFLDNWARHFSQGEYLFDISRETVYRTCTSVEPRLFPHLLRSWRATQLAVEYGYDLAQLLEWFHWNDLKYAKLYAKMNVSRMVQLTPDIEYH
jgi:hypothetical protein